MPATCPTLNHYLAADECLENLAGLGEVVYVGLKSELSAPLTATDNTYSTPAFSGTGKGLYKFELKEEAQKIAGESQGKRKGYNITGTMVFDGVDKKTSRSSAPSTTSTGSPSSPTPPATHKSSTTPTRRSASTPAVQPPTRVQQPATTAYRPSISSSVP